MVSEERKGSGEGERGGLEYASGRQGCRAEDEQEEEDG